MPRFLPLLVLALAVLYGGYWFLGRAGIEKTIGDALDRRGIGHDAVRTIGFPSRFDTTIDAPEITASGGRVAWSAPFFQIFMLSYAPHRVIAVWPATQSLRIGSAAFSVQTDRMRASAQVGLAAVTPLRRATLEADATTLISSGAPVARAARLLAALRRADPSGTEAPAYDVFAEGSGIVLTIRGLPRDFAEAPLSFRADATATMPNPIDRHLKTLAVDRLVLREATLRWAGLRITVRGRLWTGTGNTLNAETTVEVSDPDAAITLIRAAGLASDDQSAALRRGIAPLRDADGAVTVPLTVTRNRIRVMGLPLGPPA